MTIQWYLNNKTLDDIPGVSLSKIGKRVNVLTIESIDGQHAGKYTCQAKNMAGMTSHTATLIVNGLSLFISVLLKYFLN
jgi:hypothetical protein